MVKAAVLGYGTVGSGVVQVIQDNDKEIASRLGDRLEVKYILDLRDFPGDKNESLIVHDVQTIMDDPEISVVCETMGGAGAAYEFTKAALLKGKSVCTSNKELVEKHGAELISLARENGCNYLFEASVGGGIPIIRPLNTSLASERIESIKGILNGTTNYILSKMTGEGADYEETLKKAQELGYAERNPEADVEGHDAGRKIAILASLMTGQTVRFEDIHTEGISSIEAVDIKFADRLNKVVKLIASAERTDDGVSAAVTPMLLDKEHPLSGVNDVFNAIYVTGNMLGEVMFYGKGAGKLATASAVVSDVIELARAAVGKVTLPCVWTSDRVKLADHDSSESIFYIRVKEEASDRLKKELGGLKHIGDIDGFKGYLTESISEKTLKSATVAAGIDARYIRLG